MDEQEFTLLISTLVRITWFAAASKLDQVTAARAYDVETTSFSRFVEGVDTVFAEL